MNNSKEQYKPQSDFDSIIFKLNQRINNHDLYEEEREALIRQKTSIEQIKNDSTKLFPYSSFDSAIFTSYSKVDEFTLPLEERRRIYKAKIDKKKAQKLLKIINNPLNYSGWACGTPIPSEQVKFYYKDSIIAELRFACAYGIVIAKPENNLIWGGFNRTGDSLLRLINLKNN